MMKLFFITLVLLALGIAGIAVKIWAKKDGKFDVILILELLEHIDDTNHFLSIALKYLKKNGVVFVSTINKNIKSMVLAKFAAEYILNWVPKGTHDWNKFIKPEELEKLLNQEKFSTIDLKGLSFNPFTNKWKKSNDLSVNYIICSLKN